MTKAAFTTSESSAYDDQPEVRYHFPKTYLNEVKAAVGDFIVYYEPRRTEGASSRTGRQSYFAVARVLRIEEDPAKAGHYYAHIDSFLEFEHAVPFSEGAHYYEARLKKADGSTNKGAFGRSVRPLSDDEFEAILHAGFMRELAAWERTPTGVEEPPPVYAERPIIEQVIHRPFREASFRRRVRQAYSETCAVSGLRLINGGGRPEVQAAHIQPVADQGPDSVRNGLALTGTAHWLFDRGLLSVGEDYRILLARSGVPEDVGRLIHSNRQLRLPRREEWRPHPSYLKWHREHVFKG
ncbi:HNH endonuclease [Myxococcus sp. CA051A]|uniref:HNH endonuclease n=1 Tax=unclassified Myxococcus TaxID=2648731 RepID=UPI00157B962A|nr:MULTISPECIES: HNH endonuclease [unclassified Myxococcus]NTX32911.1 HNH endonuclease [Myxococcus sp. CA033]NTX60023.1 HNH endonuclease [Myxococcus sp. CA051A]